MSYFPFTFRFSVPGLSNPFASSAPAAPECRSETDDTDRLKRNVHRNSGTGMEGAAPPYRRRPPPPGSPPARLVRKRGWQPATVEPSQAAVITPSTTGIINISSTRQDMSNTHNKDVDGDDVQLGEYMRATFSSLRFRISVRSTSYRLVSMFAHCAPRVVSVRSKGLHVRSCTLLTVILPVTEHHYAVELSPLRHTRILLSTLTIGIVCFGIHTLHFTRYPSFEETQKHCRNRHLHCFQCCPCRCSGWSYCISIVSDA